MTSRIKTFNLRNGARYFNTLQLTIRVPVTYISYHFQVILIHHLRRERHINLNVNCSNSKTL